MVEDGVVDATFHDEPIAQVLPSLPFLCPLPAHTLPTHPSPSAWPFWRILEEGGDA